MKKRYPAARRVVALSSMALWSVHSTLASAAAPTAPGVPEGTVSSEQIALQWSASSDDNEVAGYNVYLNESYLTTVFSNAYEGALDTSQENSFYVTAFDTPLADEERAYSPRSESAVFERVNEDDSSPPGDGGADVSPPSIPDRPSLVSALAGSITIDWEPSSDNVGVLGYNVYRQGNYLTTVLDTRFTDNDPITDEDNIYSIVAFDEARNYTAQSESISILVGDEPLREPPNDDPENPVQEPPNDDPEAPVKDPDRETDPVNDTTAPSVPDNLVAVANGTDQVSLTWDASTDGVGVSGYNVYRDGEYLTTVQDASFVDSDLPASTSFTYYVVAFDEASNFSARSEELNVDQLTNDPVDPDEPNEPDDPTDPGNPTDPDNPRQSQ